jgi:signal transduction histidine kinase
VLEDVVASLQAICTGLRPEALEELGLTAALERLVDDIRARSNLIIDFETDSCAVHPRQPGDLDLALFRVAQEALYNCLRHAYATMVRMRFSATDTSLRLEISDDGRGFSPEDAKGARAPHLGILGMQERIRRWGGTVTIRSAVGGGTTVVATVPCEDAVLH